MPCTWQINTSVQFDAKQKTLKIKNKKVGQDTMHIVNNIKCERKTEQSVY